MHEPSTRRDLLSVDDYAARTGISPTEIRRQIRAGTLPAETFQRPQGTYYRVIVDTPEDTPSTSQEAPAARQDVSEALRILEDRLAFADSLIRANGDSLKLQAEQIDGLYRENAGLRERVGRAEERATALAAERDQLQRRLDDLARRKWWRFWRD